MILESGCAHWWIIGAHSIGHCKKCGAIRDFEKLRQEEEEHMAAIRKEKRESAATSVHKL